MTISNKKTSSLFILACCVMLMGSACAEEKSKSFTEAGVYWTHYSSTKDADHFLALSSINTMKSGTVRFWELVNRHKPYYGALSDKSLAEAECDTHGIKRIQTTGYSKQNGVGETIAFNPMDENPYYPPPGTSGATLIDMVCYIARTKN